MKKIFFALAALVLAFTGCSQEEDAIQVSEKKAVKVVVNMDKPGFGEDARAARQGWEEGDEVIVVLDGKSNAYLKLTYTGNNENPWETAYYEYVGVDGDYVKQTSWQTIASTGTAKAAYFSSGIRGIYYNAEYVSIKSNAEIFNRGECVMTCEDGTYSFTDGVLTLNITMIPQVAQFTIRGLDIADGYSVGYEGTIDVYAGGKITAGGVELNPVGEPGIEYGAWVHDNKDGISIYASPWQEAPDGFEEAVDQQGGLGFFCFYLYGTDNGYYRDFSGRSTLKNGDAVIFDGPTPGVNIWITPIPQ
ncbi:MAG: hypothetical protein IKB31_01025 [Bacteroidaceae bacterium]|nr:hypothetical protein [Bacteroidaceae bacterium]